MNLYPKHYITVDGNDGRTHALAAQIAPYSLAEKRWTGDKWVGMDLVVDVGEAQPVTCGAAGGGGFPVDAKRVTLEGMKGSDLKSDADVKAVLDRAFHLAGPYRWVACTSPGCQRTRLDVPDSNRNQSWTAAEAKGKTEKERFNGNPAKPLCESCFCAALDAEFKREQAKEKRRQEREEKQLYVQGFRWAVDCWIHPKAGGDDYQSTIYYKLKPTEREIVNELKRTSCRTDDRSEPRELKAP